MNRKQTELLEEEKKNLESILLELSENPYSEAFREAVKYKELGLIDYPKIVKKPMNLNKILKNLKKNNYSTPKNCLNDIQLVWDNCKLYNVEESDIYKVAVSLENDTRNMVDEFFGHDLKYGLNNHSYKMLMEKDNKISFEEKNRFLEDINSLKDAEELGRIVDYVKEFCPLAFKEINHEDCQIIVDNLDFKTFHECNRMVMEFLRNNNNV